MGSNMRIFEISDEDNARVNTWLMEVVYPAEIAKQQAVPENHDREIFRACWEAGYPYTGAIGGGITYSFSPTSIGMVTKVSAFGQELDLTDYGSW